MVNPVLKILIIVLFQAFFYEAFAKDGELHAAATSVSLIPSYKSVSVVGRRKGFFEKSENSFSVFFKTPLAQHDPVMARILLLKNEDRNLVFVSLDTLLITSYFTEKLLKKIKPLGLGRKDLIIGASHSHSAAGSLINNIYLEVTISDRFSEEYLDWVTDNITRGIKECFSNLRPAAFGFAVKNVYGISQNRRIKGGDVDRQLTALKVEDSLTKEAIAVLYSFGVHGTSFPSSLDMLSSELMGYASYLLEKKFAGTKFLFFNGVEGDVQPKVEGEKRIPEVRRLGKLLAAGVESLYEKIEVGPENGFSSRVLKVKIPEGPSKSLDDCMKSVIASVPHIFDFIKVDTRWLFPETYTYFHSIELGELQIVALPGELLTSLGKLVKKEFSRGRPMAIFSLVNDFIGYLPGKYDYEHGFGHEICYNATGRLTEKFILSGLSELYKLPSQHE